MRPNIGVPLAAVGLAAGAYLVAFAQLAAPENDHPVTITLVVVAPEPPANAVPPKRIYCSMSLDNWPVGGREAPRIGPSLYALTMPAPAAPRFEYKFCREASWETVEKLAGGRDRHNRVLETSGDPPAWPRVVVHHVPQWADQPIDDSGSRVLFPDAIATDDDAVIASSLTGDIRVHEAFTSKILGNERDVLVYLPPGYDDDSERRYPVLFMQDGRNVFDAETSFIGEEWGIDEAAEKLIRAGELDPLIIVAIDHSLTRGAEYTPFADALHGGGRADAYLRFLIDELKPFIDREYRTKSDRAHTAIGGASLAGLLSLYAICEHSDVFGGAAVVAPTVTWANGRIEKTALDAELAPGTRIWYEIGKGDATMQLTSLIGAPTHVAISRRIRDQFAAKLEPDALHYDEPPGDFHDEVAWRGRVEPMLKFLIGPPPRSTSTASPAHSQSPVDPE